jgi:hypothetical protein
VPVSLSVPVSVSVSVPVSVSVSVRMETILDVPFLKSALTFSLCTDFL